MQEIGNIREFCVLFQEQILIYMITVFTNYLIFLHGKHLHSHMVPIYISYMVPTYMFVIMLTC